MLITYQPKLLTKNLVAPNVYLFKFERPPQADWTFLAGQYMIIHVPQASGTPVRRLYSIASAPTQRESLNFLIEIVPGGIAGTYLSALNEGNTVTMQGAAGMFFYKSAETDKESIFLATGTGIAPMYSMIYDQLTSGSTKPLSLYWGLKTCEDVYYQEELQILAEKYPNFTLRFCLSRMEDMNQVPETMRDCALLGRVTNGLEKLLAEKGTQYEDHEYYLCGGKVVIDALKTYLDEHKVPKEHVHFEKFS